MSPVWTPRQPLPNGRGFHEKACLCQPQNLRSSTGGSHRGRSPLVGEPPFLAAWGNPPAPAFPLGETGKGIERSFPCCRRLFCHSRSAFLATADSPCFHSHSLWSCSLRCQLVSSISNGCCHLSAELSTFFQWARSPATSQSPELGELQFTQNSSGHFLFCCRRHTIPQRLVDFARHPQPVQQDRQLARHRHKRALLRILAAACR